MRDDVPDYYIPNNASYYSHPDMHEDKRLKPLYMLIKVDVDADYVKTMRDSELYAQNHCNNMHYVLMDCY